MVYGERQQNLEFIWKGKSRLAASGSEVRLLLERIEHETIDSEFKLLLPEG